MTESKSKNFSELRYVKRVIHENLGRAFREAACGKGNYAEFKDRTVTELYDVVMHDMREAEEEEKDYNYI